MATSTFSKTIYLDQAAAERLVEILETPAPLLPEVDKEFWDENDKKVSEWLSRIKC